MNILVCSVCVFFIPDEVRTLTDVKGVAAGDEHCSYT